MVRPPGALELADAAQPVAADLLRICPCKSRPAALTAPGLLCLLLRRCCPAPALALTLPSHHQGRGGMQNFDFFRVVEKDFTKSTGPGTMLSVAAAFLMVLLFFLELKAYMTVKMVTDVVMDNHIDGSNLRINFDMSMQELVCQYAEVDVSDMMGSERRNIHKDIIMKRIKESDGSLIGEYTYSDVKLEYEIHKEEEKGPVLCTVEMFGGAGFTGWNATFPPGQYDVGGMEHQGAHNDDAESLKVGEGCYVILAQDGGHSGWKAAFGPGEYDHEQLTENGATVNDASSLVVVHGDETAAQEASAKAQKDHENDVPQRGLVDSLDMNNFNQYIMDRANKMVIVDFFAPWCHWCKILEPVYKATATKLPDKPYAKDTRMAKVDCEANQHLCSEHNIRAYPTLNVYMNGDTTAAETYYGDRTVEAFFKWMEHEHKVIEIERLKKDAAEKAKEAGQPPPPDADETQEKDPLDLRMKGSNAKEGCSVEGHVAVKRVPGNLHINFAHDSFNFHNSLINATHTIHHLSFGEPLTEDQRTRIALVDTKLDNIVATTNTLDSAHFYSEHTDRTYEHFIQVVPTTYKFRNGERLQVYKYTVTSAEHEDSEKFPSAKFSYHISPMAVVISEQTVPLYHFLTNVCAIIGGLFTVFSIFNGMLDVAIKAAKKSNLGKNH